MRGFGLAFGLPLKILAYQIEWPAGEAAARAAFDAYAEKPSEKRLHLQSEPVGNSHPTQTIIIETTASEGVSLFYGNAVVALQAVLSSSFSRNAVASCVATQ